MGRWFHLNWNKGLRLNSQSPPDLSISQGKGQNDWLSNQDSLVSHQLPNISLLKIFNFVLWARHFPFVHRAWNLISFQRQPSYSSLCPTLSLLSQDTDQRLCYKQHRWRRSVAPSLSAKSTHWCGEVLNLIWPLEEYWDRRLPELQFDERAKQFSRHASSKYVNPYITLTVIYQPRATSRLHSAGTVGRVLLGACWLIFKERSYSGRVVESDSPESDLAALKCLWFLFL